MNRLGTESRLHLRILGSIPSGEMAFFASCLYPPTPQGLSPPLNPVALPCCSGAAWLGHVTSLWLRSLTWSESRPLFVASSQGCGEGEGDSRWVGVRPFSRTVPVLTHLILVHSHLTPK